MNDRKGLQRLAHQAAATRGALAILHLEASDHDAMVVQDRLHRAGWIVDVQRVADRQAFLAALKANRYQLILSDYRVPSVPGLAALDLAQQLQPDTPFLYVSGTIGEERAVETLRCGATDYLLKDCLSRLPAAVERALGEAPRRSACGDAQGVAAEYRGGAAAAEQHRAGLLTRVAQSTRLITDMLSAESIARTLTEEACSLIGARIGVTKFTPTGDGTQQADGYTQQVWAARAPDRHRTTAAAQGPPVVQQAVVQQAVVQQAVFDPQLAIVVCQQKRSLRLARSDSGPQHWGRLAVPLLGRGGKNLGVVQLADKQQGESEFTSEDEAILMQLAAVAATGIEAARLDERVCEQDQRKDEFLATLAHELRNPLAPIRTGLSVLKLVGSPDEMASARAMMERQVGHMVRLIDDLLDVSRITRGMVDLKRECVEVQSVIDAALEVTRPIIEACNHTLVIASPEQPLRIDADPTRIAQVISNLLNNAAKYTPDGGRIEVSTQRAADEVIISVQDNGVGIATEMLPKVFEMFTQVGRTIDRAQGGLGIGLALVSRLVQMHGGAVTAHSDGLGQGSRFVVRLPLAADHEAAAVGGDRAAGQSEPLAARRILVVDDNVDGAQTLALLLKFAGHTTTTAYTGPAALEVAQAFDPEVVFLDIGLPGMNGYEVAQRLRAETASHHVVLVALTGWGTDDDRRRARQAGFDHHLTKPVDAARVQSLLAEVSAMGRA